jgi:3D (Asp-Asp-Asp) domain-containing protein
MKKSRAVFEYIPWQNRPPLLISAIAAILIIATVVLLPDRRDDAMQVKAEERGNGSLAPDQLDTSSEPAAVEPLDATMFPAEIALPTAAGQPTITEVDSFIEIAIVEDGIETSLRTKARTVGKALSEAGIVIEAGDFVEPDLASALTADQEISVRRSIPLAIRVDGQVVMTESHFRSVRDVLAQAGISLDGQDYAFPGPEHELRPGDTIQVTRVREENRFEDVPVPFETIWQGVDELELDQRSLISSGTPGIMRRQYRVRYEDGIFVSETFEGESLVQAPINEVMGYGTKINVRVLETPDGPIEYWRVVKMRVTAYTAASSGKAPDHPNYGITASGLEAGKGVVAIDPKVVPFRSWVYVPGYGLGFAGDTGGSVKGRWIDLGYGEDEILAWSGYVDVFYVAPPPPPEEINYLIPTTLP